MNLPARPVQPDQLAEAVAEAVPVCLRQIVELVAVGVHAAGGDLVQQRLPHVRACAVDERNVGLAFASEPVA